MFEGSTYREEDDSSVEGAANGFLNGASLNIATSFPCSSCVSALAEVLCVVWLGRVDSVGIGASVSFVVDKLAEFDEDASGTVED